MKNECDIVKDLLFSYNDGVLSNTSKELVEEHLMSCKECKKTLEEIKKENQKEKPIKEINYLKGINKKINKKNILIIISVILLCILIFFNILVFKNYNAVASNIEVYLSDDITEEEQENIKNKLMELSDNYELEYVSKEKALEYMSYKVQDKSDFLNGYENANNPLPASFALKTTTNRIQKIIDSVQNMPGVTHINSYIKDNPYSLFFSGKYEI